MTERQDLPVGLAGLLADAARGARLPPVESWNPSRCGEIDIRIGRDGTWFHRGRTIARPEIVRLFSTVLRREGDEFYLVTPAEKLRIRVDDAPFVAVLIEAEGSGRSQRLTFTTNVGDTVTADAAHPVRVETAAQTNEPAPYILVRARLEARIARAVFYRLAELAVEAPDHPAMLGVWSAGVFFVLGPKA
ncbi:MAG: DUF1285 domain-containing protein [Alphaproteobacteria bacterium]